MKPKLYLVRLFYESKFLFVVIGLFMVLNIAANFIFKSEHTPIFVWDLYSYQIRPQQTYSFLEVRYNDDKVLLFPHTFEEPYKLFFTNTLDYFITMKRNHDIDPLKNYIDRWNKNHPFFSRILRPMKHYNDSTELKKFPKWYKEYVEQRINQPIYKIDIYEIKVAYLNNGAVKQLSSNLIYKLL